MDQNICAESVYIWTHDNGETRITDRPPPKDAKIIDILRYQPQPRVRSEALERKAEQERYDRGKKAAVQHAKKIRERAEEARFRSEEAKRAATHARKRADTLIKEVGIVRFKRKKYDLEIDRAEALAEKTRASAVEAELNALEAEMKARKAEAEALRFTDDPPAKGGSEHKTDTKAIEPTQ